MALVALGELGLDEVAAIAGQEFLGEALDQLVEQLAIAPHVARLEQRGADGLVALAVAQALVDGARGVADLEAQVPQQVEHELDDLLAARRLLVGPQEQQIDVRQRRQLAAAVAAGRHHAQPLGGAGIGGGIDALVGEIEDHADQLVHQERGGGQHLVAVVAQRPGLLEAAADLGPADGQRIAQQGEHGRTRRLGAGRQVLDQGGQGVLQRAPAHDGTAVGDLVIGFGHVGRDTTGCGSPKIGTMTRPFTLAVFTKNRVNPAYAAARLAADRVAAEAGARTTALCAPDARRCRPAEGPGRRGAGRRARRRGVRAGRRPADGARPGALRRCRHSGRDLHQSHGGQGCKLRRLRRRGRRPYRGQGPDRRPGWIGAGSSPSRARRWRRPAATGPSA